MVLEPAQCLAVDLHRSSPLALVLLSQHRQVRRELGPHGAEATHLVAQALVGLAHLRPGPLLGVGEQRAGALLRIRDDRRAPRLRIRDGGVRRPLRHDQGLAQEVVLHRVRGTDHGLEHGGLRPLVRLAQTLEELLHADGDLLEELVDVVRMVAPELLGELDLSQQLRRDLHGPPS